jgi:hypothetical protein
LDMANSFCSVGFAADRMPWSPPGDRLR